VRLSGKKEREKGRSSPARERESGFSLSLFFLCFILFQTFFFSNKNTTHKKLTPPVGLEPHDNWVTDACLTH
jgi:hypothetical protein